MKMFSSVVAVMVFLFGFIATSDANDPYLSKFKAGTWTGVVAESVNPELKGKRITASAITTPTEVKLKVTFDGTKGSEHEEWQITPNKLVQTEYNASGKATATYTATIKSGSSESEHTYDIHCTDRAAKKCDNNIDPHNSWILGITNTKFHYIVRGLTDKNNPNSVGERHRFEFQYAGK